MRRSRCPSKNPKPSPSTPDPFRPIPYDPVRVCHPSTNRTYSSLKGPQGVISYSIVPNPVSESRTRKKKDPFVCIEHRRLSHTLLKRPGSEVALPLLSSDVGRTPIFVERIFGRRYVTPPPFPPTVVSPTPWRDPNPSLSKVQGNYRIQLSIP